MMDKKLLPKDFFKNNPLEQISTAMLADFSVEIQLNDKLHSKIEELVEDRITDERHNKIAKDRKEVEQLDTGEAVITYMRKDHDNLVDPMFFKKALSMEAEAAPLIIKRFKTSGHNRFIELAFRILAKSDKKYAEQLFAEFGEIRNPYAQAMACLLFGEHNMEETVPFLLKEYDRFRKNYPDKDYHQAPLLALYILYGEAWTA